ncbi:hypothetical protein F3Y22_tig00111689pilonHSYRG00100 [Hibiscus syriacus]|uniref:NmrA-like domain-containing protein n=1 Tax=Hibiscus syriacus TaxID=106335 RepID=A0A6A2XHI8_HIBSY|nr:hypothetical protein F3Y22_tig00111689pilonHSYRG00100 [Hibiscus syriacus]
MAGKSKILIIGGTGYIGKFIVEASAKEGHPTFALLGDQVKIVAAIKEAGNVKRFFPLEFGTDVDRHHAVEQAKSAFSAGTTTPPRDKAVLNFAYVSRSYISGIDTALLRIRIVLYVAAVFNYQEAPIPINIVLSINYSIFVKGDHTNFEIEPSFGVEASELYPEVKYTTVEEYLSRFCLR